MLREKCLVKTRRHCHIGDVKKEEALLYLRSQGIREEAAADIYDLVGGRMIHLGYAASKAAKDGNSSGM